tara:strand:+ start:1141 stop:5169 length:4029 start_codon:yes stop_codon:yes gene_type:complete
LVNNYIPYDPNNDPERSSGESFVPSRREVEQKRKEIEEQRIINESIDDSQPIIKPIDQERLEAKIKDQESNLDDQGRNLQLQEQYLKDFATLNVPAINSYKAELDEKYDEINKWVSGFTPEEYGMAQGEYQQNIDSKIEEFTALQDKYNQSVDEYNKSYDTFKTEFDISLSKVKEDELNLKKDIAQYNFNLPKIPDSPSFAFTGTDTGSNTTKKPDFDIQPDFSRTGEDIGDNPAISKIDIAPDFSKVGTDTGERTDKNVYKELFKENPDKKEAERFIESLGDIDKGTFQRIEPKYPNTKDFSPDSELILDRKWIDLAKGTTPDTRSLTEIQSTYSKGSSPDRELIESRDLSINDKRKSWVNDKTLAFLSLGSLGNNPNNDQLRNAKDIFDDYINQESVERDKFSKGSQFVLDTFLVEPTKQGVEAFIQIGKNKQNQFEENKLKFFTTSISPINLMNDTFSPKDQTIWNALWYGVPANEINNIPAGTILYDTKKERKEIIDGLKDSFARMKGESGYLQTLKEDLRTTKDFQDVQRKLDSLKIENSGGYFANPRGRYVKIDDPYLRAYERLSLEEKRILNKGGETATNNFLRKVGAEGLRQAWNPTNTALTLLFVTGIAKGVGKGAIKTIKTVAKRGAKQIDNIAMKNVVGQHTFLDKASGEIFNVKQFEVKGGKKTYIAIERELKDPLKRTIGLLPKYLTTPAKKKILQLQKDFAKNRALKKFSYDDYFIADINKGIIPLTNRIKLDKAQEKIARSIETSKENLIAIGKKIEDYKSKFGNKRPELKNEINNLPKVSNQIFNEYKKILSKNEVNNLAKEYTAKQLFQLADKSPQKYTNKQFKKVLKDLNISLGKSQTKQALKNVNKALSESDNEFAKYISNVIDRVKRTPSQDLDLYFRRNANARKKLRDGLEKGKWKSFDEKRINNFINKQRTGEHQVYDYLFRPTIDSKIPFGKIRDDWGDKYYKEIVDNIPMNPVEKKLFLQQLKKQQYISATEDLKDINKLYGGKSVKKYIDDVQSKISKNAKKQIDELAETINKPSKKLKVPKITSSSQERAESIESKTKTKDLTTKKRVDVQKLQIRRLPKSNIKTLSVAQIKSILKNPVVVPPDIDVDEIKDGKSAKTFSSKSINKRSRKTISLSGSKSTNISDSINKIKQGKAVIDKTKTINVTKVKDVTKLDDGIPAKKTQPVKQAEKIKSKIKTKTRGAKATPKDDFTKNDKSIGKKGITIPRLSSSQIKSLKIEDGKNPSQVGWKQGKFYPIVDLNKSTIKFLKTQPDGLKQGKKPIDSFTVLNTSKSKPKKQRFDFGKFEAKINGNVRFTLKRKRVLPKRQLIKRNNFRKV